MSETLQQVWQIIVDSKMLNVIGALLILLIGWMIASGVSCRITSLVSKAAKKGENAAEDMPKIACADTVGDYCTTQCVCGIHRKCRYNSKSASVCF